MESPLIGHEFRFFGHRFHILESSRDTGDGSLRFEYFAPPRAHVHEHVHTFQEERFEIVSGMLGVRVGGRRSILSPGQSAGGPPKVPHEWWNPSEEEVCFTPCSWRRWYVRSGVGPIHQDCRCRCVKYCSLLCSCSRSSADYSATVFATPSTAARKPSRVDHPLRGALLPLGSAPRRAGLHCGYNPRHEPYRPPSLRRDTGRQVCQTC